jgi:hypothetical protein
VLFPNRVQRRAHQSAIRIVDTLWRDFPAIHSHAQILGSEHRLFRQTRLNRAKCTIACVVEAIGNADVKPGAARRIGHSANFSLAIDEAKPGTQRLHATRRQECPCAKGDWKEVAESRFLIQGETILPGLTMRVKIWPVIGVNQSHREKLRILGTRTIEGGNFFLR